MPVAEIQLWPTKPEYDLEVTATITTVNPENPNRPVTKEIIKGGSNLPSRRVSLEDGESIKVDIKLVSTRELDSKQSSVSSKPKV